MFILVLTHTRESQGKEESAVNKCARGFQHTNIGSVHALILGLGSTFPKDAVAPLSRQLQGAKQESWSKHATL